jgi:hypothetical protein
MISLQLTLRPSPCTGRVPGDRSSLRRAARERAWRLPRRGPPTGVRTVATPDPRHTMTDASPSYRRDPTPWPARALYPPFNPHSRSPVPRFRPTDL